MHREIRLATFFVALFALVLAGCATGLQPAGSPESVGFSSARLKEMSLAFQAGVDKKEIPGAVVLVARQGRIAYFEAFGFRDRETGAPMTHDAIFRIASMTKPVTSVAIMMLADEGRLRISDPVSRHLPQFKDLKVGVERKDASGKIELAMEAPSREMTIQDLLRHTSGLTYGFFGKSQVKDRYNAAKALDGGQTNAEMAAKLSKLPLQAQPGSTWDYSMSTDVLGRIIEVASGIELERFFEERIFKPLNMNDTGFWVSDPAKRGRIAEAYDPAKDKRAALPDKTTKTWQSGGGALVSTAMDYARFCQMLLNGGVLDGKRILSPKTVAYMASDHLDASIAPGPLYLPGAGFGFGLGFAVRRDAGVASVSGSVGEFNWGGAGGTYFWIDPKEDLFVVFSMQSPKQRTYYRPLLKNMVYGAVMKANGK
jgi:CubicO group peptidase (beta-lactamase class C family)